MTATVKQTVLITGCSEGGLGDALAQRFHITGYQVFATARNTAKLMNLFPGIEKLALDVTSQESIQSCVAEVSRMTGGTLSMLVNNAGAGFMMPLSDANLNISRQIFEVNVFGQLAVTQAFLSLIIKGKGIIVNQTSIASVINTPMQGIYNASKAATAMLSDTLRAELRPFGIKVVDLKTGLVKTNFLNNQAGDARLPKDSIYNIAEHEVEEKLLGSDYVEGAITTDEYARQVVSELRKSNLPARIWRGGKVREAWAMSTFAPCTLPDQALAYVGALDVVEQKIKERDEKEKLKHSSTGDGLFCKRGDGRYRIDSWF